MAPTPTPRWTSLTIDCADADALAAFYSRLLGWPITDRDDDGWRQLRNPEGGIGLNIQAEEWYQPPTWPERPHEQHKMMHLEVVVADLEAAIRLVLDCGGRQAPRQPVGRDSSRIRVMLDPAGHPLCLFLDGE